MVVCEMNIIALIIVFVYFTIGLCLAELGFNYLRKEYSELLNKFEAWQFVLVYVVMMVLWLPMAIEIIITKGLPKE